MSKSKKNMFKKIIILLLICLVALVILIYFLNKQYKAKKYEESIANFQKFREEYESQTILPRKLYELYNYDGGLERDYLYKHMKIFVDYMDYLKENINETNMKEFYEKNKEEIKNKTGIEELTKFENLILNIRDKNVDSEVFKYAEIEAGTSYTKDKYFYLYIYFYYGEDEIPLIIKVGLSTFKSADVKVKYEIIK